MLDKEADKRLDELAKVSAALEFCAWRLNVEIPQLVGERCLAKEGITEFRNALSFGNGEDDDPRPPKSIH
ncbi:MAG TPA: hypothetical protein VFT44_12680 [Pyrinomonadaceae bacterium]|nr:hypothetical protein [Pyrinomonadaceae bacterium]